MPKSMSDRRISLRDAIGEYNGMARIVRER